MIREHLKYMPGKELALDCGAGIGRVTKTVLKHIFKNVDLLEPSKTQMVEARKYCPEARKFHHIGLQEFEYREPYDAIWIQWVLCYLTDEDIVHFLLKTKRDGLTRDEKGKTGLIFIKENTSEQSQFLLDTEQNAVWRNKMQLKAIFQSAGYQVLHESQQGGNRVQRAGIMSITCFVLKPIFEGTSKMQQISIKLESESGEPKMS